MKLKCWMIGSLLLCAASVPVYSQDSKELAQANETRPAGSRVLLRGCVQRGTPEFCRILSGYNVTGANPPIAVGQLVELAGTVSTNVSPCVNGPVLVDIQYTARGAACE
jgi:hypothetical protein